MSGCNSVNVSATYLSKITHYYSTCGCTGCGDDKKDGARPTSCGNGVLGGFPCEGCMQSYQRFTDDLTASPGTYDECIAANIAGLTFGCTPFCCAFLFPCTMPDEVSGEGEGDNPCIRPYFGNGTDPRKPCLDPAIISLKNQKIDCEAYANPALPTERPCVATGCCSNLCYDYGRSEAPGVPPDFPMRDILGWDLCDGNSKEGSTVGFGVLNSPTFRYSSRRANTIKGVGSVTLTSGGSGYSSTVVPTVKFIGGGGNGCSAIARVSGGVVTSIDIVTEGTNYLTVPIVQIVGVGTGAAGTAVLTDIVMQGCECCGLNADFSLRRGCFDWNPIWCTQNPKTRIILSTADAFNLRFSDIYNGLASPAGGDEIQWPPCAGQPWANEKVFQTCIDLGILSATPIINSLSSDNGVWNDNTKTIVINGANFGTTEGTVRIGTQGANVTSWNATTITIEVPVLSSGTGIPLYVDVIVQTSTSNTVTLNNGYRYINGALQVTTVSPISGSENATHSLTITGNYFSSAGTLTVKLGNDLATGVSVNGTGTQITCTSIIPTITGPVDVKVTRGDGQIGILTNAFNFISTTPILDSISPVSSVEGATHSVSLFGSKFIDSVKGNVTSVMMDTTSITPFTVVSDTKITTTLPIRVNGVVSIKVGRPNVSSVMKYSATVNFEYTSADPTFTGCTSNCTGSVFGGTVVTLAGEYFGTISSVTFNGYSATNITNTATSLTCTTPLVPPLTGGGATVIAVRSDTKSATCQNCFTYTLPAPTITNVVPTGGATSGGTLFTLNGTNFVIGGTAVTINGVSATITSISSTGKSLIATSPSSGGVIGWTPITVTTAAGTATLTGASSGWNYTAIAPTITSIVNTVTGSNFGSPDGNEEVTIRGTDLLSITDCIFDTDFATSLRSKTNTSFKCDTPSGIAGPVDVKIITLGGVDVLSLGYTYVSTVPKITSILVGSVNNGVVGNTATITGENFSSTIQALTIGGVAGLSVTYVSPTKVTFVLPTQTTAGVKTVSLQFPTGTATGPFTYNSACQPTITQLSPTSGSYGGYENVTITGTNIGIGTTNPSVNFIKNGVSIPVTSWGANVSPPNTSFTVKTPINPSQGTGAYQVVVTNPGTCLSSNGATFTYGTNPATLPRILRVVRSGTSGGATWNVLGRGLAGATFTYTLTGSDRGRVSGYCACSGVTNTVGQQLITSYKEGTQTITAYISGVAVDKVTFTSRSDLDSAWCSSTSGGSSRWIWDFEINSVSDKCNACSSYAGNDQGNWYPYGSQIVRGSLQAVCPVLCQNTETPCGGACQCGSYS